LKQDSHEHRLRVPAPVQSGGNQVQLVRWSAHSTRSRSFVHHQPNSSRAVDKNSNTMMWKVRRNSRETGKKAHGTMERAKADIKSCMKKDSDHASQSSQSSTTNWEQSIRSQSDGSKGSGSRNSLSFASASEEHNASLGELSGSSLPVLKNSGTRDSQQIKSTTQPQHVKSVRFSEIHIRDYERIVGDNPSCTAGPPIG
jgi:hypothetical protein